MVRRRARGTRAPVAGAPGLGADLAPDLRRDHLLSRFPPASEAAYERWLAAQVLPLSRALATLSIPIWLSIPLVVWLVPDAAIGSMWVVPYLNAALLVVALHAQRAAPDRSVAIAGGALFVLGVDTMFMLHRIDEVNRPGAVTAAAILFAFLCPFIRTPFRTTCAIAPALVGTAAVLLVVEARSTTQTLGTLTHLLLLLATSVAMVLSTAMVAEARARAKWVDEQVIERQQALLVESRRLLRRYAPPAVAERIELGDASSVGAPQRRRVTVLFSDVVGFTDLADRVDPEALAEVVNEYLGTLASIIERHGGTLNEFAGDGVMAIFGAPAPLDPEAQVGCAVAAAREIRRTLPVLNQTWHRLGVDQDLSTRIGINTGVLSVGSFGSEGRATYTGIGLQTNIAARIQAQAEPGGILLSRASWELVKHTVPCEARGSVTVKGVHFPIDVFAVPPDAGE